MYSLAATATQVIFFYKQREACHVEADLVAAAAVVASTQGDKMVNQTTKSPVQANGQHRNGVDEAEEFEEYEHYHEEVVDLGEGILG